MAEACGFCHRSFLPSRKLNESLKCACKRPFFSQSVARNNLPTDRDCWIEVPKRFVRHYSSLFGESVHFEGDDGRSYSCSLVGSDVAIVGYGFEWYSFASSHNVGMGDQVVFTLIEKSRFLVQIYKANPLTVKVEVKLEQDVDVQEAGAQDWLLAKARRSGTNISVKVEPVIDDRPADVDRVQLKTTGAQERNDEIDGKIPSSKNCDEQLVQAKAQSEDAKDEGAEDDDAESEDEEPSSSSASDSEWSLKGSKRKKTGTRKGSGQKDRLEGSDDETSGPTTSDDAKGTPGSPLLYLPPYRKKSKHLWAEPGTTRRKTYVSKRRPVTCVEREGVLEAAKACPIIHNSYLRQLAKDNVYRCLILAIPVTWYRENMPKQHNSYKGTLVDKEGNSWLTRIRRKRIFWEQFSLDHCLEEDDVVVMELVDSRVKSLKILVHIFRVVDVTMTLKGKAGWAVHYNIVQGKKKMQTSRKLLKAKAQSEDAKCEGAEVDNAESENGNANSDSASSTSDNDCSLRVSRRETLDSKWINESGQNNSMEVSDDETSRAMSDNAKRSTSSPHLYVQKNRDFAHHWAKPGTTRRKTYVSKRRPVTCAERERVLEAAKACRITHNSYLRQLEKDNCYRALVLAIPARWCRENMPKTKKSYKGTLVDEEGNSWQTRIRGTELYWGNFTLDQCLEEDDVVVVELLDPRVESLKLLVHIFRVVDAKKTVSGKAGWAVHYHIVEGIQKGARAQLFKAQAKVRSSNSASGRQLRRKRAATLRTVDSENDSDRSNSAVETSRKRLARRGRSQAVTYKFSDSEDDSDRSNSAAETTRKRLARRGRSQAVTYKFSDSEDDSDRSNSAVETSRKRLTRRGRSRAFPHKTSDPEDDSGRSNSAVETSRKRLTRRGRSQAATYRTVDSEVDIEDSLPLQHARDSNKGGPSLSEPKRYHSVGGAGSSAGGGPSTKQNAEEKWHKQCVICWDAPAEAVCIPCGHLAGCMDCLTAIKAEDWGCPVCRASIQQVVKVYAV